MHRGSKTMRGDLKFSFWLVTYIELVRRMQKLQLFAYTAAPFLNGEAIYRSQPVYYSY